MKFLGFFMIIVFAVVTASCQDANITRIVGQDFRDPVIKNVFSNTEVRCVEKYVVDYMADTPFSETKSFYAVGFPNSGETNSCVSTDEWMWMHGGAYIEFSTSGFGDGSEKEIIESLEIFLGHKEGLNLCRNICSMNSIPFEKYQNLSSLAHQLSLSDNSDVIWKTSSIPKGYNRPFKEYTMKENGYYTVPSGCFGGTNHLVSFYYYNEKIHSMLISVPEIKKVKLEMKENQVLSMNELDLSFLKNGVAWKLVAEEADIPNEISSSMKKKLRKGSEVYDLMYRSGFRCTKKMRAFNNPVYSGYHYEIESGAVRIRTTVCPIFLKNKDTFYFERFNSVFIDVNLLKNYNLIKLPENLFVPQSVQECYANYKSIYERKSYNGRYNVVASEKISFLFENGDLKRLLYYGGVQCPDGDEVNILMGKKR